MSRAFAHSALPDRTPNSVALDFPRYVSSLALARGILADAKHYAAEVSSERVARILQRAGEIGTTADPSWSASLADHAIMSETWIAGLRHTGVFDSHAVDAIPAPMKTRLVVVVAGVDANAPAEAGLKEISSLGLAQGVLEARKTHVEVVVSEEVARLGGPAALALLDREMRQAVTAATDQLYLAGIAANAAEITASGTDSAAFLEDLGAALAAIESGDGARFHVVLPSATAKALSTMTTADGALAFPDLAPDGGMIGAFPAEVSDGLAGFGSPELPAIMVIDASQLVADTGQVVAASSSQATVTVDGVSLSLFQSNLLASRVERYFAFEAVRSAIAAVIVGAAYGSAETSP